MILIFIAFFFRLLLSYYDVHIANLPGAEQDALRFHTVALEYSKYLNDKANFLETSFEYTRGWWYSVFLGTLYNFFGISSKLFASYLSCFVWIVSALTFRKIMLKLNIRKDYRYFAILLYCFAFPTSIIYTAVTLREVYLMCCFNFLVLLIINIHDTKKIIIKFLYVLTIFFILYLLTLLHRSNLYFVLLFLLLIIFYFLINKLNLSKLFLIISGIFIIYFSTYFGYTEFLFNISKNYQIGHFTPGHEDRAAYYIRSDITELKFSLITIFTHFFTNIYHYLFQPTIFKIENLKDTITMYENLLRIALISFALRKSFLKFDKKILFNIFLIMFMLMEIIYSQATVNWGTASRHHVPVMGVIILLAFFPSYKVKLKKKHLIIK